MPLWTLNNPPTWFPEAELTKEGWENGNTGELLVAMQGEEGLVGPGTGLKRILRGSARIQINDPQEQLGGAAIQNTTDHVVVGVSRLQITQDWVQESISRIQATTTHAWGANCSVRNTTTKTLSGVSDVRVTTQQNMTGSYLVVQRLNLPNLLVEYGFYSRPDLIITDLTGKGNDGILSASGDYTNLGLRLDGSQEIAIPPAALPSSYFPFTVFVILQPEVFDDTLDLIVYFYGNQTPDYYAMYYYDSIGLEVDINIADWANKFNPTKNVPFSIVQQYNPIGQLDTRLSENSNQVTKSGVFDFSEIGPPTFLGQNGVVGSIRGTMIYFAIIQGDISNGEAGYLFKFARRMLLARGTNTLSTEDFEPSAFQVGTFQ